MRAGSRQRWLVALALSLAVSVASQDRGPGFVLQGEGGLVTAFALDPSFPSTIYAATARGLSKTIGAGAGWNRMGAGLHNHSLLAVAVGALSPANLSSGQDTRKSVSANRASGSIHCSWQRKPRASTVSISSPASYL